MARKKKELKHNPKLNSQRDRRREVVEEEPYEYRKNYTPVYMAIIFIAVVLTIVLLFVFVFNVEGPRVEKYDRVQLDYEIYTLEQYENHEDPEIKKTNKWVNVCHRYDDDCKEKKLIKGFYNELLGKKEGDVANYELIEACVDKDKDGEDDTSGDEALSYGFPDDKLYDTDIVLWFKIHKIEKRNTTNGEEARLSSSNISYKRINQNTLKSSANYCIVLSKNEGIHIWLEVQFRALTAHLIFE